MRGSAGESGNFSAVDVEWKILACLVKIVLDVVAEACRHVSKEFTWGIGEFVGACDLGFFGFVINLLEFFQGEPNGVLKVLAKDVDGYIALRVTSTVLVLPLLPEIISTGPPLSVAHLSYLGTRPLRKICWLGICNSGCFAIIWAIRLHDLVSL